MIALPGTLLDARSLRQALAGWPKRGESDATHIELLGEQASLDTELDRLATVAHRLAARTGRADSAQVWLGHSLGGIVALHLAVRHPDLVAGLVLLAANARGGEHTNATRRTAQWQLAQTRGLRALATDKLGAGYGLSSDDHVVEQLADQAEQVGLHRFKNQLHYATSRPGLLARQQRLKIPMLLLSGELDTLCPPSHSEEALTQVATPGLAHHLALRGAGHLFPWLSPGWVAAELRLFAHKVGVPRLA